MKTKPIWERGMVGVFFAGLAAVAIPTAQAGSGLRDDIVETFAVKGGGTLTFDSDLANLEITTSETDTLRAEFTREFKVSNAQEAQALRQKVDVQMVKTDAGVRVTVRWTGGHNDRERQKARLDFRIAMPRKFNLDLRTIGSAQVDDLNGTVKAVMIGGSLRLKSVGGPVSARTRGGSVSVGDVGGDLEVKAEGGSVDAGRVNGHVLALAQGGSVSIKEAIDSIEAKAEGGSVAAYISKQPRGDSKLIAEAGNVELRLPESIAINIDAACSAGQLSSDFSLNGHQDEEHLKGKINGGGPLVMVRASAGNISVHK
jgi:Putative adhesin